jgi:uncharacterized protein YcfJ
MKKLALSIGLLAVVACAPVHASSITQWGTVTQVRPIHTQVSQQTPKNVCEQVQVPIYSNNGQSNSGNAILGAIIGGVIGNQFGSGSGKQAATGIGAAIGAVKGSQTGNQKIVGYQTTNQCRTVYSTSSVNVVNEYDVTYRVGGHEITMRVNRAVGERAYVGQQKKFRLRYQIIN